METSIESLISFLEETNDPTTAYFSYDVDDTGEYGVIKANQQGLRLYAAEMLKKSLQLQQPNASQLFFEQKDWMMSDDFIRCVVPHNQLASEPTEPQQQRSGSIKNEAGDIIHPAKGCFFSLVLIMTGCAAFLFAAVKWFR